MSFGIKREENEKVKYFITILTQCYFSMYFTILLFQGNQMKNASSCFPPGDYIMDEKLKHFICLSIYTNFDIIFNGFIVNSRWFSLLKAYHYDSEAIFFLKTTGRKEEEKETLTTFRVCPRAHRYCNMNLCWIYFFMICIAINYSLLV